MQHDQQHQEVFHHGERAAQQLTGVRERLAELGSRVIRDRMPEQHREFFALLPWLLVGSVDGNGQPWASVVSGMPGFVSSPNSRYLNIAATPLPADPLNENLFDGAAVGLLGLQSHTRRRNRANGTVTYADDAGFVVNVEQSFGNCPKYIQAREAIFPGAAANAGPVQRLAGLDLAARKLIGAADTFFIATAHPDSGVIATERQAMQGVDVSHRGGRPGFVQIEDDALLVPDYTGNFFFNTVGNLLLEPRAGLLFIDFSNNDVLQLAVTVEVIWDGPLLARFAGAQRLLCMKVSELIRHPQALSLQWGEAQMSPYLY